MARFGWIAVFSIALALCHLTPAHAQESVRDVLSFLLTNPSIPMADFVRDEERLRRRATASPSSC